MDLDIRGEMEAVAGELEAEGQSFGDSQDVGTPASEPETPSESTEQSSEQPAAPATEETPTAKAETPAPDPDELPLGGSIPVPRVRKIIENARAKARAEAEAQAQALAWAKEVDRAQVEEALGVMRYANENPVEFYRAITSKLRSDPRLAQEIERVWTPAQPQQKPEEKDPKPQADILLEDGRWTYSSDRWDQVRAWTERQLEQKLMAKVAPLEQVHLRAQQEVAVERESQRMLKEVLTWPGMQDEANRKAVAQAMINGRLNVEVAYRQAVLPKLTDTKAIEDRVRKQVLAELKNKARAGTVNPQRVVSDPESFRGKTVREILEATASELGFED